MVKRELQTLPAAVHRRPRRKLSSTTTRARLLFYTKAFKPISKSATQSLESPLRRRQTSGLRVPSPHWVPKAFKVLKDCRVRVSPPY